MKSNNEKKTYNSNFIDAFKNSINGIIYGLKSQMNIKIQICIALIVIIVAIILKLNKWEFIILTFAIFLVVVAEMINTAIEKTVDLCTEEYNEKAKIAKDVAAGAVLLASLNSVIIAVYIFLM